MKISCAKEISFCLAHRIYQHEGRCENLHGHNYRLKVYFNNKNSELDNLGRVADFSLIKERIKTWIDLNWDHTTIIYDQDKSLLKAHAIVSQNKPPYIVSFNTTVEQMGIYLFTEIIPKLFKEDNLTIQKIDLFETEKSWISIAL